MIGNIRKLEADAAKIRIGILEGLQNVRAGHIGGTMSMAEIMAVLYGGVMKVNPSDPGWEGRDWLVVSKGHCGPAVYSTLAINGFFPYEELKTINSGGTRLPSHCDRNLTPGIDMTTGSLGQGMSTAIGVAFGHKYLNHDNRTFLILGDGELQEGQIWEGALFAAHHKLNNLIAFVDQNGKQLDGYTDNICALGDVAEKFTSFGWKAIDCNGNDIADLLAAVCEAETETEKPVVIVARTKKGLGCTFAEDVMNNHHVAFSEEECGEAIEALRAKLADLTKEDENV